MSIDCIYSKTEQMIARSVRNEIAVDHTQLMR
jgi:hypothetical protein